MAATLRPVVLITGASRGIGHAIARQFAAHGRDLFLVARDAGRLAATAAAIENDFAVRVAYAPFDLAQRHAPGVLLAALTRAGCFVDVLVNCAGVAVGGQFVGNDAVSAQRTLGLKVKTVTALMYACLPGMVERRRGGILNIASLAGVTPMPYLALYGATKAYLISLSRAVATEVAGAGVTVSVVLPGPVDTGFFASNLAARASGVALLPGLSPDAVARTAIEGFLAGQRVITPGLVGGLSRLGLKLLPYRVLAPFLGRAFGRRHAESSSAPILPHVRTRQPTTPTVPARDHAVAATAQA
jgi:hypothetical protein